MKSESSARTPRPKSAGDAVRSSISLEIFRASNNPKKNGTSSPPAWCRISLRSPFLAHNDARSDAPRARSSSTATVEFKTVDFALSIFGWQRRPKRPVKRQKKSAIYRFLQVISGVFLPIPVVRISPPKAADSNSARAPSPNTKTSKTATGDRLGVHQYTVLFVVLGSRPPAGKEMETSRA